MMNPKQFDKGTGHGCMHACCCTTHHCQYHQHCPCSFRWVSSSIAASHSQLMLAMRPMQEDDRLDSETSIGEAEIERLEAEMGDLPQDSELGAVSNDLAEIMNASKKRQRCTEAATPFRACTFQTPVTLPRRLCGFEGCCQMPMQA